MQNGLYTASFAVGSGMGFGVVTYMDGRITGGDSSFAYIGSVQENGSTITGNIEVFQHHPGMDNVFAGLTHFDLAIRGEAVNDQSAALSGTTTSAPGAEVKVTLTFLRPL